MKHRLLPLILLFVLPLLSFGQDFTIMESDNHHVSLRFELSDYTLDTVRCNGELMHTIATKGIVAPNEYGSPDLPTFNRFIAIPQGAKAVLEVRETRAEHMEQINIAPAIGCLGEYDEEPPFYKNPKMYTRDEFYPAATAIVAEPQSLRGVDVIHLGVCPFQFNPVRQEIAVNRQIDIEIRFEGGNGHFGEDRLRSPYWDPILQNVILNYGSLEPIDYHTRRQQWIQGRQTGCEYMILVPDNEAFVQAAQELADYRTRQGILTKVINIAETGAEDYGMLRLWFREIYNNWDIPPVAVCILADVGSDMHSYIPAVRTISPKDGFISSDNPYADINGDCLPDVCFSRLVAQNEAELPIFIGKQIEYEFGNPNMSAFCYNHPLTAAAWQDAKWFQITIATISGYLTQHGKQPSRINEVYSGEVGEGWSTANNTSSITNYFGPNGLGYIPATPAELGGWTGGTAQNVIQAINFGTYLIQHRDHGWTQKWYQPEIYVSDFTSINNPGKMPFLISVNCKTGQYDYTSNCFTEALMRMTREGENAGIVGAISPSGQTYSFGNDIYLWGVWDLFDPQFLPDYGPYADHVAEWLPAFANISGKYFLEEHVFPNTDEDMRTTIYNTFHSHCDAFLRVFTEVPQPIEASFDQTVTSFAPYHVTAPEGVEIALSAYYGGKSHLLATATGTGEEQTLYVMGFVPANRVKLTMTGLNLLRREETIVMNPIEGPFVVADSVAVNNGIQYIPFGESATVNLTLKNYGSESNETGIATLTNVPAQMQVTQGTTDFPTLMPDESIDIENAFSFDLTDDIPDLTVVPYSITTQFGDESYEREFDLTVIAPNLTASLAFIDDENGNGDLDPGEFATLYFTIRNIGHYEAVNPRITLENTEGYIRVLTPELTLNTMGIGVSEDISFDIYVEYLAGEVPSVELKLISTVNNLIMENDIRCLIGFRKENFESGTFDPIYWTNDPEHPWHIETVDPYEGLYCAQSDTSITHNESSYLTFKYTSNDEGTFSFFSKVSSETNYDFLIFSIDGEEKDRWSGNIPWYDYSFDVSPGQHEYTWTYVKDYSVNSGSDCAWIDYITLPPYLDETAEQVDNALTIHPNPTTDMIWLDIEQEDDFVIRVYDINGKLILTQQNERIISFKDKPSGLYHITVTQNGQRWSSKMIKL